MAASANTSYDAASIVMSLLEFIHHPVAHELVHNGAMFQVFLVFLTPHVFLFHLSENNNQDQIFFVILWGYIFFQSSADDYKYMGLPVAAESHSRGTCCIRVVWQSFIN
jgi:hypothetical protein